MLKNVGKKGSYEQLEDERDKRKGGGVGVFEIDGDVNLDLDIPEDKGNVCYWAYFSLGTGVLFPWNAFITAVDYFQDLYPKQHVDRVFGVTYMFPNLLVLGVLLLHPLGLSTSHRIYVGFFLYLFCLFSVPLIDAVLIGDTGSEGTWTFTVAAVALAGVADGIAQGSVFGSVTMLPSSYTQAVVSGTSVSGLVISVLRVLTKALISQDEKGLRTSTFIYFGAAGAFCLFCIAIQCILPKLPFYRHFNDQHHLKGSSSNEGGHGDFAKGSHLSDAETNGGDLHIVESTSSIGSLFVQTWSMGLSLFFAYAVTLSIFPGFLAEDVESEALGDWYPILLITFFNLMDFLGKTCPILDSFRFHNPVKLFAISLLRCAFYPLYLLATSGPALLKGEPLGPIYVSIITGALGFSNGWLTSNCLIEAPLRVVAQDAEKTEMLMVWFLLLGLLVGALLGWIWLL